MQEIRRKDMKGVVRKVRIGVIGASSASGKDLALARDVGAEIARRGAILVCGGLGGVMEAACRGAKEEGGLTVGILPGRDAQKANPHVDVPIATDLGYARNVIVVLSSQALIAVTGRYGTLSEIAHALNFGIPVIGLFTWDLNSIDREKRIIAAADPKQAVDLAVGAIQSRR